MEWSVLLRVRICYLRGARPFARFWVARRISMHCRGSGGSGSCLDVSGAPRRPLESTNPRLCFSGMLRSPQLWLLGLVQMASFGLVIVIGVWISTYLTKSFHLTPVQAGRIGSLVLVIGVATRPIGGMLVPRWGARRTLRDRPCVSLCAIACLCFGLGTASLIRAAVGVFLLGVGAGLPYAGVFNRCCCHSIRPGRERPWVL